MVRKCHVEYWNWSWIVKDGRIFCLFKLLIAELVCNKMYIDILDRRK